MYLYQQRESKFQLDSRSRLAWQLFHQRLSQFAWASRCELVSVLAYRSAYLPVVSVTALAVRDRQSVSATVAALALLYVLDSARQPQSVFLWASA